MSLLLDACFLIAAAAIGAWLMGWFYARIAPDRLRRMWVNHEAVRPGSAAQPVAYQHQIYLGGAAAAVYAPLLALFVIGAV